MLAEFKNFQNDESRVQNAAQGDDVVTEELVTLLNGLPIAALIINTKGIVEFCNSVANTLLSQDWSGSSWIHVITQVFSPQEDDGHEISTRNGKRVRIETNSLPKGKGQIITLIDLTDTRNLQAALNHQSRLEHIGKMAASLAHQIRTPLSTAMIYAANLNRDNLSEDKKQQYVAKIMDKLCYIERQIKDVLLYGKKEQCECEAYAINLALEKSIQMVAKQFELSDSSIEVQNISDTFQVRGNMDAMVGALVNLFNNALEASRDHVSIKIYALSEGGKLYLHISDDGPGIEKEALNKIFDPFFTTKNTGTGLGLAVVKSVIENHGGRISVRSEQGVGTQFVLELPYE